MKWYKLVDYTDEFIGRGEVLRMRSKYPYEDIVDFMVFDPIEKGYGMGLIVSSGHKAGLISVLLPLESLGSVSRGAIETKWLIENWNKWVFSDCDVSQVCIAEQYDVPTELPC